MKKRTYLFLLLIIGASFAIYFIMGCSGGPSTIKIGFNLPLSGELAKVGESSRNAAEMLREEINSSGGLKIGGDRFILEFIYEDNQSSPEAAIMAAKKLIAQYGVLAVVGPNSSRQAIPAGAICNAKQTPMISPWSTNPGTTRNRPWVFRAAYLDHFQGPVVANFASRKFNADRAAVLYDNSNAYSRDLAAIFRKAWERKKGDGNVVAFESHKVRESDFSSQLTTIINANPDFIFVPDNYNQAAAIVKQARALGWEGPIMGSDAWGSSELIPLCGDSCLGMFFTTHYIAKGAKGVTKEFIEKFRQYYKKTPDGVAALTWDAARLIVEAIKSAKSVSPNPENERKMIRNGLSSIREFEGVTGKMRFDSQGDPIKCAIVAKITDDGEFTFEKSVCP